MGIKVYQFFFFNDAQIPPKVLIQLGKTEDIVLKKLPI